MLVRYWWTFASKTPSLPWMWWRWSCLSCWDVLKYSKGAPYEVITIADGLGYGSPHCLHPMESTLCNLAKMKNSARKSINTENNTSIRLVRVHHMVKCCQLNQQQDNSVCKNEREFRLNPWSYAQKKLQSTKDSKELSFSVSTAVQLFTQTYSSDNTQYHQLPSWITNDLPNCVCLIQLQSLLHW